MAAWSILVTCFLVFCGVLVLRFRSGKWKTILLSGEMAGQN